MDLNINGVNKAALLATLYNNTRPLSMGFLHDLGRDMTQAEAEALLSSHAEGLDQKDAVWFDYVHGRPIKVGFRGDTLLRADLYDRDAPGGDGTCALLIDVLRS